MHMAGSHGSLSLSVTEAHDRCTPANVDPGVAAYHVAFYTGLPCCDYISWDAATTAECIGCCARMGGEKV